MNDTLATKDFPQTDYNARVSKNSPVSAEILRLTLDNRSHNCTYHLHSYQRIHSADLFHVDPDSGSIVLARSLKETMQRDHLLSVIHRCPNDPHISHTRVHIAVVDDQQLTNRKTSSYQFTQDEYLVLFEASLASREERLLMHFDLTYVDSSANEMPPDLHIVEGTKRCSYSSHHCFVAGDPFGLFAIEPVNHSLILLDPSRSRSYAYPLRLKIVGASSEESISCTVTIFVTNLALPWICPPRQHSSLHLFTYESSPRHAVDPLTGQHYAPYDSLVIHAVDPWTPLDTIECVTHSERNRTSKSILNEINFIFTQEIYYGQANGSFNYIYHHQHPLHLSVRHQHLLPVTYQFLHQPHADLFHLDPHAGIIRYSSNRINASLRCSLIVVAQYQSSFTFTRLVIDVHHGQQWENTSKSSYQFQLFRPLVNNYTIGYVESISGHFRLLSRPMGKLFGIEHTDGRLFVRNQTLLSLSSKKAFDFFIQDSARQMIRIQILLSTRESLPCRLNRFSPMLDNHSIGFIEIINRNSTAPTCPYARRRQFHLLNHNDHFTLDREHGLLTHRHPTSLIPKEVTLLVEIEHARCLIALPDLSLSVQRNEAPVFSQDSYTFSVHLSRDTFRRLSVGQITAHAYDRTRSRLVYQFVRRIDHFLLHPDSGMIDYISARSHRKTVEHVEIVARDLIYAHNATVRVTIHILRSEFNSWAPQIYRKTISEILPPGSLIFQLNLSRQQNLRYSLQDQNQHNQPFRIDPKSGDVILLSYLSDSFYSFNIHISPIEQIIIVQLLVQDWNNHPPTFLPFPVNLTVSSDQTFVTKLTAVDLDIHDNVKLVYHLSDQEMFSIDPTTGIITLTGPPLANQSLIQLNVAVSDGLYVTEGRLWVHVEDYSTHAPEFTSDEYVFQSHDVLGPIVAYDADLNDRLRYKLHLEPNGIRIDPQSGLIIMDSTLFDEPVIDFYISASDRAEQMAYARIRIYFPVQPMFTSHLYVISLAEPITIPSEIFRFHLVDAFNQPIAPTRYELDLASLFEINGSRLIVRERLHFTKIYNLTVVAHWNSIRLQSALRIQLTDQVSPFDRDSYEWTIDVNSLQPNDLISNFSISNATLSIVPTPLTRKNCVNNFHLKQQQLFFSNYPILANRCLFELRSTHGHVLFSSQVTVRFVDALARPVLSSNVYHFYASNHHRHFRVFARSDNAIRYRLPADAHGLQINTTTGELTLRDSLDAPDRIQSTVDAFDEQTHQKNTALIQVSFHRRRPFDPPTDPSSIPACPSAPKLLSEKSTLGTIVQDVHLDTGTDRTFYYILSGDHYGLFAVDAPGQIVLASTQLNRTSAKSFQLIVLISTASSISYCQTRILIRRSIPWSSFICPAVIPSSLTPPISSSSSSLLRCPFNGPSTKNLHSARPSVHSEISFLWSTITLVGWSTSPCV